jgi:hypothetical protein
MTVTNTIATMLPEVTTAMGGFLPDFAVYAATGLVVGLAVVAVRRLVKGLR